MRIGDQETHPLADVFPMASDAELEQLVASIRARGFDDDHRIVRVYDPARPNKKLILDGRNRLKACEKAGVTPKYDDRPILEDGTGKGLGNLTKYVIARNLARRHLRESQRAMIAADLATLGFGSNQHAVKPSAPTKARATKAAAPTLPLPPAGEPSANVQTQPLSQTEAAAMMNVSPRLVAHAAEVKKSAAPEVEQAVRGGVLTASAAAELARRPVEEQRTIIEQVSKPAKSNRDGEAPEIKASEVRGLVRRAAKVDLGKKLDAEPPPLPTGPFRVIVADPPWPYEARADDPTQRGQITYPPMPIEKICALPVGEMAHPDGCVLWLWTTNAFMEQAFVVLRAWGFEPKTILTWVKDRIGAGHYLRNTTEHCILAVRGKKPVCLVTNQRSDIRGEVREHSRKPESFYDLVESLCPGSKVEMFAREVRPGWEPWGAEVGKFRSLTERLGGLGAPDDGRCLGCTEPDCATCLAKAADRVAAEPLPGANALLDENGRALDFDDDVTDDEAAEAAADGSQDDPPGIADRSAEGTGTDLDDVDDFERQRGELVRRRPDVRVDLHELSAAMAHNLGARPDDAFAVRIEHGTGSSTGTVCGPTRVEALADARARLDAPHAQHAEETLRRGAELRTLERTVDGWCMTRGPEGAGAEVAKGTAHYLPDGTFEVVLGTVSGTTTVKGRGVARDAMQAFHAAATQHEKGEARHAKAATPARPRREPRPRAAPAPKPKRRAKAATKAGGKRR